jgi:hypothetical protein
MRWGVFINLVVVVLLAGVAGAEQSVQPFSGNIIVMAVEEPNAPDQQIRALGQNGPALWNPGEHLRATWESIYAAQTYRIYNPALQPPRPPEGPNYALSLSGEIAITDGTGLIGLTTVPTEALALDQAGRVVFSALTDSAPARSYQPPHCQWGPTWRTTPHIEPYPLSVSLPAGPGTTYPQALGTLEWSLYALVADQFTTVDVPFQAGGTWTELAPGVKILVEQATAGNAQYQYRLQAENDANNVAWLVAGNLDVPAGRTPPGVIVVDLDMLDATGRSLRDVSAVSGGIGIGGQKSGGTDIRTTMFILGVGNGPACGTAATFRFKLARNAYTRQIRFLLADVPVPTFGN